MFGKKKFNSIKINNEEDEETAKTVVNFMKWTQFLIEAAFSSCVFSMDDANFHFFSLQNNECFEFVCHVERKMR